MQRVVESTMRSTYSSGVTVVIDGEELTEAEVDERISMLKAKLTVLQDAKQQLVARQYPANDGGKSVRASMLMSTSILRGSSSIDVLEEENPTLVARASNTSLSPEDGDEGNILMARHVIVGHKLGSGFFGDVYQGEWRGIPVALKFVSVEGAEELARESATLDALDHPNVMRLYGLVRRRHPDKPEHPPNWPGTLSPPCIVCELAAGGTFLGFLKKASVAAQHDLGYWSSMLAKVVGAADGLAYLHSMQLMHRDLKAENLLISSAGELKIADFGLAKSRDARLKQTSSVGTFSHMAPEVMRGKYDLSCDIFSFGIVLTEVLVAEEAQEIIDQTRTSEFGLSVKKLKAFLDELLHPAGCFRLAEVAGECCELDPTKRPDALELLRVLDELQQEVEGAADLEAQGFRLSSAEEGSAQSSDRRSSNPSGDPVPPSGTERDAPPTTATTATTAATAATAADADAQLEAVPASPSETPTSRVQEDEQRIYQRIEERVQQRIAAAEEAAAGTVEPEANAAAEPPLGLAAVQSAPTRTFGASPRGSARSPNTPVAVGRLGSLPETPREGSQASPPAGEPKGSGLLSAREAAGSSPTCSRQLSGPSSQKGTPCNSARRPPSMLMRSQSSQHFASVESSLASDGDSTPLPIGRTRSSTMNAPANRGSDLTQSELIGFERCRTTKIAQLSTVELQGRQSEALKRRDKLLRAKSNPEGGGEALENVRAAWGANLMATIAAEQAQQQAQQRGGETMMTARGVAVYGMDKELEAKAALKYDHGLEADTRKWLEALLGEPLSTDEPLVDALHSGVALCDLLNAIEPGAVAKVRRGEEGRPPKAFHCIENVGNFLGGLQALGLAQSDLFEVNDLINRKNPGQVLHTLTAVRRRHADRTGQPKPPSTPRKKQSTDSFSSILGSFSSAGDRSSGGSDKIKK